MKRFWPLVFLVLLALLFIPMVMPPIPAPDGILVDSVTVAAPVDQAELARAGPMVATESPSYVNNMLTAPVSVFSDEGMVFTASLTEPNNLFLALATLIVVCLALILYTLRMSRRQSRLLAVPRSVLTEPIFLPG